MLSFVGVYEVIERSSVQTAFCQLQVGHTSRPCIQDWHLLPNTLHSSKKLTPKTYLIEVKDDCYIDSWEGGSEALSSDMAQDPKAHQQRDSASRKPFTRRMPPAAGKDNYRNHSS